MKKLLTLSLLLCSGMVQAQRFDMFLSGGISSHNATTVDYKFTGFPGSGYNGRHVDPEPSGGYYLGLGAEFSAGKGAIKPGVQLQAQFIGCTLVSEEYMIIAGQSLQKMKGGYNMQYVRIAPSFILKRNFSVFRTAFTIGPDYNISTNQLDSYTGMHIGLSGGIKGIMLDIGYTRGFTTMFAYTDNDDDAMIASSVTLGLSLYPWRFAK